MGKHWVSLKFDLQLALCGQDPETALNSALASVNFYLQQQQLYFEFREAQLQKKINKVQEACKKKLQEVHTGYTAVSTRHIASPASIKMCITVHTLPLLVWKCLQSVYSVVTGFSTFIVYKVAHTLAAVLSSSCRVVLLKLCMGR